MDLLHLYFSDYNEFNRKKYNKIKIKDIDNYINEKNQELKDKINIEINFNCNNENNLNKNFEYCEYLKNYLNNIIK